MKATGARNRDVLALFIIESGLLGLIGGLIGVALGTVLAYLAVTGANTALDTELLRVSFSFPLLLASVAFTFLLGIIAGAIPAWQASRLHPVEALRG